MRSPQLSCAGCAGCAGYVLHIVARSRVSAKSTPDTPENPWKRSLFEVFGNRSAWWMCQNVPAHPAHPQKSSLFSGCKPGTRPGTPGTFFCPAMNDDPVEDQEEVIVSRLSCTNCDGPGCLDSFRGGIS
jgi:hypothetical protein